MIYFDNASTTKASKSAVEAMVRVLSENFGNPSSLHALGIEAEKEIKQAEKTILKILSATDEKIVFTSSGTEANNLAIRGAVYSRKGRFNGLVFDAAQHESVTASAKRLQKEGFNVTAAAPLSNGSADLQKIVSAVDEKTAMVSLTLVNNETGSITDVSSAVKKIKAKNKNTLVHVDAVAAFCKREINFKKLGADIMTISAHKVHGPKGIGAVIFKKDVRLEPLIYGSSQQNNLKPGTEPVSSIAAFSAAAKESYEKMNDANQRAKEISGYLREELLKIEGITLNSPSDASDYLVNFSTNSVKSEVMLHFLEENGIYVSSGSACSKGKNSHVLEGMGLKRESVLSAVRVSLSDENTLTEVKKFIETLKKGLSVLIKSF